MLQIIMSVFIWIAGIMALPLLTDVIDGARTGLACATPAIITDGTKLLCLIVDTGAIILIWTILLVIINLLIGATNR